MLWHNSQVSSPATQRSPQLCGRGRGGHQESADSGFLEVPITIWDLGQVTLSFVTSLNGSPLPGYSFSQQTFTESYYVLGTVLDAMDSGKQDCVGPQLHGSYNLVRKTEVDMN